MPASEIDELNESENVTHQRIREQLRQNIEALKKLENKLTKHKSLYKKAKSAALPSYGRKQKSKIELITQLKEELQRVYEESEQNKLQKASTGHLLMTKVRNVLEKFEPQINKSPILIQENNEFSKVMTDIRSPHFLAARKNIQTLTQGIIQSANNENKYKRVKDDKRLQDHIDVSISESNTPSKARDPNVKLGDLLSLYLPSPLEKRDQIAINALTEYVNDFERSNNPVTPKTTNYHLCRAISHLNSLDNLLNMINLKTLEFKDPEDLHVYLNREVENFNIRCQDFMDSVDALNDLSLSIQLEDQLKQLQNNFEENLPKEYKDTPEYQALMQPKERGADIPLATFDTQIYRDIMQKPLSKLSALEATLETKPHSIKSKYKELKKDALHKLGKNHHTKYEIVNSLRSSLNAINNALDNKESKLTEKQLHKLIQNALNEAEELQKHRVGFLKPKQMDTLNAIVNDLKNGLTQFEKAKRRLKQ
ncbi:MAG: hypothetical protein HYX61_10995 [Gammaproteobacteria bacterium]|nr:hypothetical protein [Gammaproteobacteria bacterium]